MLADPDWGTLDMAAIARPRRRPDHLRRHGARLAPGHRPRGRRAIGAPVEVIAGAGHTPHHTHPEAFAAAIAR